MGELVVKDAANAELHRALPTVDRSRLAFEVPAAVLDRATYPHTIDPTVSPEYPCPTPCGPPPRTSSLSRRWLSTAPTTCRAAQLWQPAFAGPSDRPRPRRDQCPREADGWILVMCDLSRWILLDGRGLTRAESRRIIMAFHVLQAVDQCTQTGASLRP